MRLPQEQPPTDDNRLSEWLTRLVISINSVFDTIKDYEPISGIPSKIYDGLVEFFDSAIPPDIAYSGPWVIVDGVWRPMVSMYNNGEHQLGKEYYPQDTVYGDGWTMSCKTRTFDYPFPTPTGPQEVSPSTDPVFTTETYTGVVTAGMFVTFSQGGHFGGLEVYISEVTASTTYEVVIEDRTDLDNIQFRKIPFLNPVANSWNFVVITEQVIVAGEIRRIYLKSLNSGGTITFQYPWVYRGIENTIGPITGEANKRQQNDIYRISKVDGDAVDHTLELQVIPDTTFTITSIANPNKFSIFLVIGAYVDGGTYYEYPVVLIDQQLNGPDPAEAVQIKADQPIAQSTEYVRELNHWPTDQPTYASIDGYLALDGVDQVTPDNAYGVRISFTPAEISEDWEFVAYSPDLASVNAAAAAIADSVSRVNINATEVITVNQLIAADFTDQIPVGLDVPLKVSFGPAQALANFILSADGTIVVGDSGFYEFSVILLGGRANINMECNIIVYFAINGVNTPTSSLIRVDSSKDRSAFSLGTTQELTSLDQVDIFIVRDSGGANDGGLYTYATSTIGVSDVPSAWLRVTKKELLI